jgi:hypothetical protein
MVRISVLNDTLKVGEYECYSCELHATRRRKWSRLAVPRAFVSAVDFRIFFCFLFLLLSFALSAEPREGGGGGFLETFSTPLTKDSAT